MTIAILTTTGNTGVLKSHIKGNIKAGNSIETITAAIIQVMPYVGFPNSFAALKTVKKLYIITIDTVDIMCGIYKIILNNLEPK